MSSPRAPARPPEAAPRGASPARPPDGSSAPPAAAAAELSVPPRLAVPKMGVRARIAEWPPRRDPPPKDPSPQAPRDPPGPAPRDPPASGGRPQAFKALQRLARRRSKEVEFQEAWGRAAPGAPLRQRSSSEVTLSECDPEEAAAAAAAAPGGGAHGGGAAAGGGAGAGLYREYGSTSSIDVQGVSEQSFFEMLNELRAKRLPREAGSRQGEAGSRQGETNSRQGETNSRQGETNSRQGEARNGCREDPSPPPGKEKPRRRCPKGGGGGGGEGGGGGGGGDSIFKKLRAPREAAGEEAKPPPPQLAEPARPWQCHKSFAHYDVQSLLFDLNLVAANQALVAHRRNTTTGASAASTSRLKGGGLEAPPGGGGGPGGGFSPSPSEAGEELSWKEDLEEDLGDDTSNELLLSCPHFRNEVGGAAQRDLSFSRASPAPCPPGGAWPEAPGAFRPTNAGVSVLEVPRELRGDPGRLRHHSVEHVDLGARYYREHFHGKEHSNYFGLDERLGPVAISIRRERLEEPREQGPHYQYRIICRTSELSTLRGSILEEATPGAAKPGPLRGLPLRDTLELLLPELNLHCLRLASGAPRVTEQLLKLDEQGLCRRHKVGILYCKAGQGSEEEMYNNEEAGPALEEFLSLLGEKVSLKAFPKYAAQLDTKTDSTGTHSLYTTYQDYEIMFHVSTMLPYTPNNRQQLLRKRHIGNDIVTIIFQEPGALPFTPQQIRSHFQHVFIVVRAHHPCSERLRYSVAVSRSKDVPPFGPPIPAGVTFRRSEPFRDFLLAKVLNAEHAAHKSPKFHAMATRTRREYLKDLAQHHVTGTPLDSLGGKFNLISLAPKRKEKAKARLGAAERLSAGALCWRLAAQDFGRGGEVPCLLAVSNEFVVLLDLRAREVAFNCFCGDVVGWSAEGPRLKLFHGRGDHVLLRAPGPEEVREVVQRLKAVTGGCEASELTLRRNGLGQLGFHVRPDGTVAEVEEYGFAWQAGLRRGSRLLEVCKVALASLTHEQMIDLLRTSVTVTVVTVPPRPDGSPRRGWLEELRLDPPPPAEPSADADPGGRPAYRANGGGWQWGGGGGGGAGPGPAPGPGPALGSGPAPSPGGEPSADGDPGVVAGGRPPCRANGGGWQWGGGGSAGPGPVPAPGPSPGPSPGGDPSSDGDPGVVAAGRPPCRANGGGWQWGGGGGGSSGGGAGPGKWPEVVAGKRPEGAGGGGGPGRGAKAAVVHREPQPLHGKRPVSYPETPPQPSSCSSSSSSPAQGFRQPSGSFSAPGSSAGHGPGHGAAHSAPYRHHDRSAPPQRPPVPPEADGALESSLEWHRAEPLWHVPAATRLPGTSSLGTKRAGTKESPSRHCKAEAAAPGSSPSGSTASGDERWAEAPDPGPPPDDPPPPPSKEPPGDALDPPPGPGGVPPAAPPQDGDAKGEPSPPGHRRHPPGTPDPFKLPGSRLAPAAYDPSPRGGPPPKSFFSKQPLRTKQPPGAWKRPLEPPDPKKQVEAGAKNVFGQPRLRASLRDLRSPRRSHKSSIEDDLKRLIIMDPAAGEAPGPSPPAKGLQRTLSDESLCGGRRDLSSPHGPPAPAATSSGGGASASTGGGAASGGAGPGAGPGPFPSSTLPGRRPLPAERRALLAAETPPGLMPLPDPAAGLEWASLVSAARAYEVQRAVSLFSLTEPALSPDPPAAPSSPPLDLPGKVSQLEAMLRQLHSDLQKEKQDKVVLQAEVASLRQNNRRLQEESSSAARQLRRFARIFSGAGDKEEL